MLRTRVAERVDATIAELDARRHPRRAARQKAGRRDATRALADHHRPLRPPAGRRGGPAFLAWVEQFLALTLAPGDIVVADNLSSHKVAGVRQAIEARGASLRFLPSHSPDLNPTELLFSKLKRLLRSTAARTVNALWPAIGQLLDQFDPAECANYLRHCGYAHAGR